MIRLFLTIFFILSVAASLPSAAQAGFIAAGQMHTCAWDGRADERPICWGNNDHAQLNVPDITNLSALGAGTWHTCAAYTPSNRQAMITCWGDRSFGQGDVPQVEGAVVQLSVGRWHNCAIWTSERVSPLVRCWGKNQLGQRDVPSNLGAVDAVYAGADYSCALLPAGDVRCWGSIFGTFPATQFPHVSSTSNFTCRAIASGVDCWTNRKVRGQSSITLSNQVSGYPVREALSCTLNGLTVSCQSANPRFQQIPVLRNPSDLTVGDFHACALDDTGIVCWGDNTERQCFDPPRMASLNFGPSFSGFSQTSGFFAILADFTYSFDERLLHGLQATIDRLGPDASLFTMMAARPFLAGFPYTQVRDAWVVPAVTRLDSITAPQNIRTLRDLPQSAVNREAALRILALSISTARSVMTEAARSSSEPLVAALVDHYTAGTNPSPAELASLGDFFSGLVGESYLRERVTLAQGLVAFLGD